MDIETEGGRDLRAILEILQATWQYRGLQAPEGIRAFIIERVLQDLWPLRRDKSALIDEAIVRFDRLSAMFPPVSYERA